MRDRYVEWFVFTDDEAIRMASRLSEDYKEVGTYQVGSGWVVWADRESKEEA